MYTHIYGMLFKTHRDSEIPNGGCILVFVLPGMERGKGEVTPGHRESLENSGSRVSRKTKHRTRDGFRPVCERLAGRGSRVREVRRLYATDGKVSDE